MSFISRRRALQLDLVVIGLKASLLPPQQRHSTVPYFLLKKAYFRSLMRRFLNGRNRLYRDDIDMGDILAIDMS